MLEKAYEPKKYEDEISKKWEKSGFFNPDVCKEQGVTSDEAPHFSVVLPPPNVTGTLHMGHAAMLAIEDTLVRYHRMKGDQTLWVPGTDHAAVATESKVEGLLIKEGMQKPKQELGREEFLNRVKKFAQESHDTIVNQCKKMGSSLDWSREAYTLDDARNRAVREVFKRMYEDGLIYRGYRVVNWSVKGQSTCSDDELEYIERPAKLYYFKYHKDFPITIATTRPETKLGDTAVAVHPNGKWKKYIGKTFEVQDVGQKGHILKIKIIASESVDENFGTGALGVTPAHSMVDFDMYQEQKRLGDPIELIQVIGEDGRMTEKAGSEYQGLTVEEARAKFVEYIRAEGLLEKEEDTVQNVGTSDRFKDPVEPLPKTQWFVDVNKRFVLHESQIDSVKSEEEITLKELMQKVVQNGQIEIIPDRFQKTYFRWIDNLRDWCISRQIWFGHRIPVWYCASCGKEYVNKEMKGNWYFVRHGETDWNKEKKVQGHTDIPLNENGKAQAQTTAKYFENLKIDLVISSDLQRAKETADTIAKHIGVEHLHDERLRERSYGIYEGRDHQEMRDAHPQDETLYDFVPENGESWREVEVRIQDVIEHHKKGHAHKNVVIVTHGGVMRVLWYKLKNLDKKFFYGPNTKSIGNTEVFHYSISTPCDSCGSDFYEQDPDTLDTWFSSGLWTFSTLGWPTTSVQFIRHGEAENNVQGKLDDGTNHVESHLTEKGEGQIRELAKELKDAKPDIIFTSPVARTKETAEILSSRLGIEVIEDERLREVGVGKLNGKQEEKLDEVREDNGWTVQTPYDIEPYDRLRTRTHSFLTEVLEKYRGKKIAVVSHGDVLEVLKQFGTNEKGKSWEKIQGRGTVDTRLYGSDNTPRVDLPIFHPTSVLETGYDILFFWVARMILMTTYTLGTIPFQKVYLHGLVRDEQGRKMSKTLGNIIDPLDMIEKYGTDATRLSLLLGNTPGNDMKLSEEKIAGFRNFANKLWNMSRFMLLNISRPQKVISKPNPKSDFDKYILFELDILTSRIHSLLNDNLSLSYAGELLREFTWTKLADWYLEVAKIEGDKTQMLNYLLNTILKLWHPFMPFVTETIWQEIYGTNSVLMIEKYPQSSFNTKNLYMDGEVTGYTLDYDRKTLKEISDTQVLTSKLMEIISSIREFRSVRSIDPSKKIDLYISAGKNLKFLERNIDLIKNLRTGVSNIEIKRKIEKPANCLLLFVEGIDGIFVNSDNLIDTEKEITRIEKEIATVAPYVESLEKKLSGDFAKNAPAAIVEKEKQKFMEAKEKLEKLQEQLSQFKN